MRFLSVGNCVKLLKGAHFERRLAHGIGFEGGLVTMLVPFMAYWLNVSLLEAFFAELGLLLMFFIYAVAFTWRFDKILGLSACAISRQHKT